MTNEWKKVELYGANNDGTPRRYTIADGASISKGQLLSLADPRTAAGAAAYNYCGGVALEEHLPGVGETSISGWTDGVFTVTASLAIIAGAGIMAAEDNKVMQAPSSFAAVASGAAILGYALDDIADGTTGEVRLRL